MAYWIDRLRTAICLTDLGNYPAVAILGPRQCGKSSLAKSILATRQHSILLDLELPSDLRKLDDPELFLADKADRLVCIDEIQRRPELFPVLRALIDRDRRPGRFLILGSASRDLIRQSSESLAGRISFIHLSPLLETEVTGRIKGGLRCYWLRGGFPDSLLAADDAVSLRWRQNLIATYLERDLPTLGFRFAQEGLRRLWTMLSADQGQLLNASRLGTALGISHTSVRSWIAALEGAFLLRSLLPFYSNEGKRLVKSPKVYVRDSGLLHALLDISTFDELLGRSILGPSWEGLVVENLLELLPEWKASFYRSKDGAEIDLVLEKGERRVAVEAKASVAPALSRGFHNAIKDLGIEECYVASPVEEAWALKGGIVVASPAEIGRRISAG
ncbi:MAG: ATP-binding protein [Spirochaetaceae bacterium]|nr:ATP-binding protein [Spirochaetaceae bacterium]